MEISLLTIFFNGALLLLSAFVLLWVLSLILKDASIVDIFWGPGYSVAALAWLYNYDYLSVKSVLLIAVLGLWSMRLGIYLFWRNHGKGEDKRYVKFRKEGGKNWWLRSLFTVFILQFLLMIIVALPVFYGVSTTTPFSLLNKIGLGIALLGILLEASADFQLSSYLKIPSAEKKPYCDLGLWKYSRHPNYFGDAVFWWGLFFAAFNSAHWFTIISPLVMNFLLVKVSGVALLESDLKKRKEGYREYIGRTNAFIPGPPKA